jgi:hypothetical protein
MDVEALRNHETLAEGRRTMGFFDALRRVLGHHAPEHAPADRGLAKVWGLDESSQSAVAGGEPEPADATAYDRARWAKQLKRVIEELPASKREWTDLMAEARSLHFDTRWIHDCVCEEFRLMVRRAVSDRKFTEAEHRRLDLVRELMGIPEAEAEAILHTVVAEAEAFFGKSVEET